MLNELTKIIKEIFGGTTPVECVLVDAYKELKKSYKFRIQEDIILTMNINEKTPTTITKLLVVSKGVEYLLINDYYQHIPITKKTIKRALVPIIAYL